MRKIKGKLKQGIDNNPIEQALRDWDLNDLLGFTNPSEKQEKQHFEDQGVIFTNRQSEKSEPQEEKEVMVAPDIDYSKEVVSVAEKASSKEKREIEHQLREIMAEIKKLTDSSKELQIQFKEIAVEQYVATPGEYHKSFFSWLLSIIKAARMKVEDSGAWLQAMQSKKKAKGYQAMAKKQGTSFTLNNERTVATQVG